MQLQLPISRDLVNPWPYLDNKIIIALGNMFIESNL